MTLKFKIGDKVRWSNLQDEDKEEWGDMYKKLSKETFIINGFETYENKGGYILNLIGERYIFYDEDLSLVEIEDWRGEFE